NFMIANGLFFCGPRARRAWQRDRRNQLPDRSYPPGTYENSTRGKSLSFHLAFYLSGTCKADARKDRGRLLWKIRETKHRNWSDRISRSPPPPGAPARQNRWREWQ